MARNQDFGDAMVREIERQAKARLIARTPLGRYYTTLQRLRSGTFLQPRYLVPALFSLLFMIGSALVSCAGLFTAWLMQR